MILLTDCPTIQRMFGHAIHLPQSPLGQPWTLHFIPGLFQGPSCHGTRIYFDRIRVEDEHSEAPTLYLSRGPQLLLSARLSRAKA